MLVALLVALPAICYALYRAFLKFFGPVYAPGAVAEFAAARPDSFDDPALHAETTDTTWTMPDGITLHRMQTPRAPPATAQPVLCVSGGPGVALRAPWAVCSADRLTSHFAFHTIHPRGCGQSTHPFDAFPGTNLSGLSTLEHKLGLSAQVGDIERIRRRLGVDRLALLGHSFGGLVATLYAAEFPQHVASLALVAPASMLCTPGTDFDFFAALRSRIESAERAAFDKFLARYLDFASLPTLRDADAADRLREFFDWYLRAEGVTDATERAQRAGRDELGGWAMYATYCSLGRYFDLRDALTRRLADARFRTVVVNGRDDIVPTSEGLKYAALFPPGLVECKVVNGGHFLVDEEPDVCADAIFATLSSRW